MVAVLGFNKEQIFEAVQEMYTDVATKPKFPFHFPVGRPALLQVGYDEQLLEGIPAEAQESFAGVACPFNAGVIQPGDRVLDVGAGSGTDTMIASARVGPKGTVLALDMTPAMLEKHRRIFAGSAASNIESIEGNAEKIPLEDASVDVVTSNGVLNLVPDKAAAAAEIFRVLRPGGKVQIADIVVKTPFSEDCASDPKLWAECVVGATIDEEYEKIFRAAGFTDYKVIRSHDYFSLSPSEDTRQVAAKFGAYAVELVMTRP